jgi:uncharacterized protein YdeI (YjbR/CyaY-like superfamily)
MKIQFFKTPAEFRKCLTTHHAKAEELMVGFYKTKSGKKSITWPEAVDEALCFGWIDGIRRSIDETSYQIRFTPRKARSTWSSINIKRVDELMKLGKMQPSGIKAFEKRDEKRSGIYAYEQRGQELPKIYMDRFKENKKAWKFFSGQAPWYQRTATWWVISAKREETKLKRLGKLISDSANEKRIDQLTRPDARK